METTNVEVVSPIETALAQNNITAQVIERLKTDYLGLKINGLEDKAGFKKVEDARKECKALRNLAANICKKGREDAIKIQKDWIAKEKEVVSDISQVEDYLEGQSNEIKELEKQILFEAAQKAKLPARIEKLASIDISVEDAELLKMSDEQFNTVFNQFHEQKLAEKAEALKQEQQRIAAEAPDKEKLTKWVADMQIGLTPNLGGEAHKLACDIHVKLEGFKKWANEQIEKL